MKPNPHEIINRSIKVGKFVLSIEDTCRIEGVNFVRRVDELIAGMERWSDVEWNEAFLARGLHPPGKDGQTKADVLEALKTRADDLKRERGLRVVR